MRLFGSFEKETKFILVNADVDDVLQDPAYLVCVVCERKVPAQTNKIRKSGKYSKMSGGKCVNIGQQTLDDHMKIHDQKFECDKCGKNFLDNHRLKAHMTYHQEKIHSCELCGRTFHTNAQLQEHIIVKHVNSLDFECDECQKKFPSKLTLKSHTKYIHGPKEFFCEHCSSGFKTRPKLKQHHLQVHTEAQDRPFKCSFDGCDWTFATGTKLRSHECSHTGDKPHKCDVCEAAFPRKDSLKKHMMTHTGEKPYLCSVCGKGFIQSCNRDAHSVKCHNPLKVSELSTTDSKTGSTMRMEEAGPGLLNPYHQMSQFAKLYQAHSDSLSPASNRFNMGRDEPDS